MRRINREGRRWGSWGRERGGGDGIESGSDSWLSDEKFNCFAQSIGNRAVDRRRIGRTRSRHPLFSLSAYPTSVVGIEFSSHSTLSTTEWIARWKESRLEEGMGDRNQRKDIWWRLEEGRRLYSTISNSTLVLKRKRAIEKHRIDISFVGRRGLSFWLDWSVGITRFVAKVNARIWRKTVVKIKKDNIFIQGKDKRLGIYLFLFF